MPGPRSSGSTMRFCPSPKRLSARVRSAGWSRRFSGFIASRTEVRPYMIQTKTVSPTKTSRLTISGFMARTMTRESP
ncbi:MAG TPA: hypothetical protein VMT11_16775 [Myxococcaceae bacterium]|nr:hypothetical protein [Myxococcaceae bacterium]